VRNPMDREFRHPWASDRAQTSEQSGFPRAFKR
jgi:hypothetical protein